MSLAGLNATLGKVSKVNIPQGYLESRQNKELVISDKTGVNHYAKTQLMVNKACINNTDVITIGNDTEIVTLPDGTKKTVYNPVRENCKDYILSKLFSFLHDNKDHKLVYADNLGLDYDQIIIDTNIKTPGQSKSTEWQGRNKTELRQKSTDRYESMQSSQARTVVNIRYGDQTNDWVEFGLDKIVYFVKGKIGAEYKILFSTIGKIDCNPDKLIQKYFPSLKTYPNLGKTVTSPCKVTANTELREFFNTDKITLDCLLTVGNKGLITLGYGGVTLPIGMILKDKKQSYQWVNTTKIEVEQYLNRNVGIPHKLKGTLTLHRYTGKQSIKGISISQGKATLSMLYADLSKVFGGIFDTFLTNGKFYIRNKAGVETCLAKLVDNGEDNRVAIKPVNIGYLTWDTISNLLNQNKTYLGRYLTNNTSFDLDKANDTFDKLLRKDYRKVYNALYFTLQGNNPSLTTDYDRLLNQAIGYYGQNFCKDAIIQSKRDIKQGMTASDAITNFHKIM